MKHSGRRAGGSPAKRACRGVAWDEQNLARCEAGKDAKMKIDEPETPWASPPKELFSDEETGEPRGGGAARGGADMQHVAAQLAAASAGAARGEWDTSDDEMAAAGEALAHQGEEGAAAGAHGEAQEDAALRQRLFEARRKAFQGRYRAAKPGQPPPEADRDEEEQGEGAPHAAAA